MNATYSTLWYFMAGTSPRRYEDPKLVQSAMRSAIRRGLNPYDSHTSYARAWNKLMRDRARRTKEQ